MNSNEPTAEDFKQLMKDVKELSVRLKERLNIVGNGEKKTLVLLLGPTGSGKTTLFHELINKHLNVIDGNFGPELEATEIIEDFKIGHTMIAETSFPGLYYDDQIDVIYCDCPGFFDNRGEIQDIINSFAIYLLSTFASRIKIILITSQYDILSTRAQIFNDNTKMVEKLVQDENYYNNSIAMVITKSSRIQVDGNLINRLNIRSRSSLLQSLGRHETEKVFLFPEPSAEMINQRYTLFTDRDRLINFITSGNQNINRPFHISLSRDAKLLIFNYTDTFGSLPEILGRFVQLLINDCSFQTNEIQSNDNEIDEKLNKMNQTLKLLSETDFPDPESFINKVSEIINPLTPEYEKIFKDMSELLEWRSFIDQIISDFEDADRIRNDNSMIALFFDINYFLKRNLNGCKSILSSTIERRKLEKLNAKTNEQLHKIESLFNQTKEETKKEMQNLYSQIQFLNDQLKRAMESKKRRGRILGLLGPALALLPITNCYT